MREKGEENNRNKGKKSKSPAATAVIVVLTEKQTNKQQIPLGDVAATLPENIHACSH